MISRISLDSWDAIGRAYGTGILFAAQFYIQDNPDWYMKLGRGLIYSIAWPYSLYKGVFH
jgi:hypothetical protein